MAELFHSGLIIDFILLMVAAEACVLLLLRRVRGRGPVVYDWLPNLASGACLLLALRASIAQAAWYWLELLLALSLLAHLADLGRRFRS
jgi:hypothetical protein